MNCNGRCTTKGTYRHLGRARVASHSVKQAVGGIELRLCATRELHRRALRRYSAEHDLVTELEFVPIYERDKVSGLTADEKTCVK